MLRADRQIGGRVWQISPLYIGILLSPKCKINYVHMQLIYVDMQHIHVIMRDNYLDN